jgi:hypothetical protein
MTTEAAAFVPGGIGYGRNMTLAGMTADDRDKHHAAKLQAIGFWDGANGIKAYRADNPDAAGVLANVKSIAYRRKPKGYEAAVIGIVEGWLDTKTAAFQSNRADVARLNKSLQTQRFNPDNHFSRPLSLSLGESIGDAFDKRGVRFDLKGSDTPSKVRDAAKTGKNRANAAAKCFGPTGTIAGNVLTLGAMSFPLETHNDHACVRVSVKGKRVRLRLDALEVLLGAVPKPGLTGDYPLPTTTIRSIGELAPDDLAAVFEPVEDGKTVEPDPLSDLKPVELAPLSDLPAPTLTERIANLAAMSRHEPSPVPDDVDPLTL